MKKILQFLQLAVAVLIACTVFQCILHASLFPLIFTASGAAIYLYIDEEIKKLKTEL